jgi:aconitate hydratase 2/2-methylisocitrate dehydratase
LKKYLIKMRLGIRQEKLLHAGSDVRVTVNIVGSQDTTGLMTSQELESMAATVISPLLMVLTSPVVILHQFGTINRKQYSKMMKFMNDFGLITAQDPRRISRHDRCYSQSF